MSIEKVIAAAYLHPTGLVTVGYNHDDAAYTCDSSGRWCACRDRTSGFLTNTGRFVDHEEALHVARSSNQLSSDYPGATMILSEAFWMDARNLNPRFGRPAPTGIPDHVVLDPVRRALKKLKAILRSGSPDERLLERRIRQAASRSHILTSVHVRYALLKPLWERVEWLLEQARSRDELPEETQWLDEWALTGSPSLTT